MLPAANAINYKAQRHHRFIRTILAVWLLCLSSLTSAIAQQDIEQQKIDYLIASVESLKDASFIRNGSSYNAEQAASHMRLKLSMAGSRVKTAEDFIVYCATESSVTGTKYIIRFSDGHIVESAAFLRNKLVTFKASD